MSRKRKCRYTPEELALHKEAVRLRNMTDKQLVEEFHRAARHGTGIQPSQRGAGWREAAGPIGDTSAVKNARHGPCRGQVQGHQERDRLQGGAACDGNGADVMDAARYRAAAAAQAQPAAGEIWEEMIEASCRHYRLTGREITKTPEPMKPLGRPNSRGSSFPATPSRPSRTTKGRSRAGGPSCSRQSTRTATACSRAS